MFNIYFRWTTNFVICQMHNSEQFMTIGKAESNYYRFIAYKYR